MKLASNVAPHGSDITDKFYCTGFYSLCLAAVQRCSLHRFRAFT